MHNLIQKFKTNSGKIFNLAIVAQAHQHKINKIITKNIKDFPSNDFV